jgi:hypothetical protein
VPGVSGIFLFGAVGFQPQGALCARGFLFFRLSCLKNKKGAISFGNIGQTKKPSVRQHPLRTSRPPVPKDEKYIQHGAYYRRVVRNIPLIRHRQDGLSAVEWADQVSWQFQSNHL